MNHRKTGNAPLVPVLAMPGAATHDDIPFIHFASDGQPPQRRTIRGQRRRPGSDRPSSGRAEAPRRDNRPSSGGSGLPPVSGGGNFYPPTGGGMGGFPGGTRGAAGGGGILLTICAIIAYLSLIHI